MFRIDAADNVAGQFGEGNPATGQPGTKVSAEWLNTVQEELARVIEAFGLTLDKANSGQLATALVSGIDVSGITQGTNWAASGVNHHVKKIGSRVHINWFGALSAPGSFSVLATLPVGARPVTGLVNVVGYIFDISASKSYPALFSINGTNGQISVNGYANGAEFVAPFAGDTGDGASFHVSFPIA